MGYLQITLKARIGGHKVNLEGFAIQISREKGRLALNTGPGTSFIGTDYDGDYGPKDSIVD
jgi:hypothetical protein